MGTGEAKTYLGVKCPIMIPLIIMLFFQLVAFQTSTEIIRKMWRTRMISRRVAIFTFFRVILLFIVIGQVDAPPTVRIKSFNT